MHHQLSMFMFHATTFFLYRFCATLAIMQLHAWRPWYFSFAKLQQHDIVAGGLAVLAIGGCTGKVRDIAAAAFVFGHSVRHWIVNISTIPVCMIKEGQLALPAIQRPSQGPFSSLVHQARVSLQPAVVCAAA